MRSNNEMHVVEAGNRETCVVAAGFPVCPTEWKVVLFTELRNIR